MDRWAEWLLNKRFGGNKEIANYSLQRLGEARDRIFSAANISLGNTVVDIGSGDGLLAIAAIEKVGPTGKVIFVDISQDALSICQEFCREKLQVDNTQFICTSAEDLSDIPTESVDVIVARAVLMYVSDKTKCFREFYRILRDDGRISISEPVNQFTAKAIADKKNFFGLDFQPLGELGDRLLSNFNFPPNFTEDPMLNFNEHDLMIGLYEAGFNKLSLQFNASINSDTKWYSWDAFMKMAINPTVPSFSEAFQTFSPVEQEKIEAYLKPLVESSFILQAFGEAFVSGSKKK